MIFLQDQPIHGADDAEAAPANQGKTARRGPGSFCVPRAAIDALIKAQASAYEVVAYLVLARFTDESGLYSKASISAINRYTGANKTRNGPAAKALERLKTIKVEKVKRVHNDLKGKSGKMVDQVEDLGPILYDREAWIAHTGEVLPDGPTDRGKVMYVLPDFEEDLPERVWFGNGLVDGHGQFAMPLKTLKDAGPVAARLLLMLYALNDMETWGGVRPVGEQQGPWQRYEPVTSASAWKDSASILRAKRAGGVCSTSCLEGAWSSGNKNWDSAHTEAGSPVWSALTALEAAGFIYEVVLVLNRNATKQTFSSGAEYSGIPLDAEPYYELDCRSMHGYKPAGESDGIGWLTAKTAGELGMPVTLADGKFDHTYAAIVPKGFGCMIAGIYRLRFRVANPKNAGVSGTWAGIHMRNREALDFVNRQRVANNLPALASPAGHEVKSIKPSRTSKVGAADIPDAFVDDL